LRLKKINLTPFSPPRLQRKEIRGLSIMIHPTNTRHKAMRWTIMGAVLFILMIIGTVMAFFVVPDWKVEITLRRGQAVVHALDAHKHDCGVFPDSLTDLRPKYLSQVPPPLLNTREWSYTPSADHSHFRLGVKENKDHWHDPAYTYDSRNRQWDLTDTK
jgi:hypothetical protein